VALSAAVSVAGMMETMKKKSNKQLQILSRETLRLLSRRSRWDSMDRNIGRDAPVRNLDAEKDTVNAINLALTARMLVNVRVVPTVLDQNQNQKA